MEENKLIKFDGGALQKVGNAIAITNKLLLTPLVNATSLAKTQPIPQKVSQSVLNSVLRTHLQSDLYRRHPETIDSFLENLVNNGYSPSQVESARKANIDLAPNSKPVSNETQKGLHHSGSTEAIGKKQAAIEAKKFFNRGLEKDKLQDYKGAVADYNTALVFNSEDAETYYRRGLSKMMLGEKDKGCTDLSKAGELGCKEAYEALKKYCNF